MKLSELRAHNERWFSRKNRKFFGDIDYRIIHGKDKKPYLVRYTSGFSDMFGRTKQYFYVINPVEDKYKIASMLDEKFISLEDVKEFIKEL